MSLTSDRLREAMADREIDQSALARSIGVTQGTISHILLGKTSRSKHLPVIARELGVGLAWLMGLDDEKRPAGAEQVLLTPGERKLVDSFRLTSPVHWPTITEMVGALVIRRAIGLGTLSVVGDEHPSEDALAEGFEAILSVSKNMSQAELARELAKRLPALLRLAGGAAAVQPSVSTPEPAEASAIRAPAARARRRA